MTFELIIYEVIKYFNCIFEMFLFYYFLDSLFPVYEERRGYRIMDVVLIASLLYAVNWLRIPALNFVMAFMGFTGLFWLIFRKGLRTALPYSILCIVVLASIEVIFMYVYHLLGVDYQNPDISRVVLLLLQGVLRFLIVAVLRKNKRDVWLHGQSVNQCQLVKLRS